MRLCIHNRRVSATFGKKEKAMNGLFGLAFALVTSFSWIGFAGPIAQPQASANVVGTWDITIESPQGKRESQLVIKQDGGKLTGAMKSPRGERLLDSVKVEGSDITFVMT